MVVSSASTGTLRALLNTLIYLWVGQLIIAPTVSGTSNLSPQDGYNDAMNAVGHKRVKRSGECYNSGEECTGDNTGLTGSCYLVGDSNIPSDTEPEESSHCQGPECNCWVPKTVIEPLTSLDPIHPPTTTPADSQYPCCTPEECCEGPDDCFFLTASRQCFCYFTPENPQNWDEAKKMCKNHRSPNHHMKFKLPHPFDAVALQDAIVEQRGNCDEIWMDAKCGYEGIPYYKHKMYWQDIRGVHDFPAIEITERNPFFAFNPWTPRCEDGTCLEIIANEYAMDEYPSGKPYYTASCADKHHHIICEKTCQNN